MKVNRFFRGLQNTVGLNRSPTLTWLSAIFLLLAALGSNSAFAQSLLTSEQPNRANAIELEGAEVAGDVHVFFGDTGSIRSVVFYLDDEDTTGSPNQTENFAPYDFAGTVSGNGRPFDTTTINDGPHSITAVVTAQNGTQSTVTAQFNVVNNPVTDPDEPVDTSEFSLQTSSNPDRSGAIDLEAATTSDIIYIFLGFTNTPSQVEFFLDNADAVGTPNQTEGRAPFDFAGTGSGDVALPFDTNTIADGLHSVTARITTATNEVGTIGPVFFTVSNTEPQDDDPPPPPPTACAPISTLPCIDVRLIDSLALDFTGNAGGIEDANGIGTGFTMVDVPSFPGNPTPNQNAPGLFADNVVVDQTTGKLQITTTPGINYLGTNSLDNALGFGLNVPSSNIAIEATLSDLPTPAGGFSQGGIWFGRGANFGLGTSEDSYIKMVAISTASGSYSVQALMENGVTITQNQQGIPATTAALTLRLELDPVARTVVAKYNTGGQDVVLSTFTQVPDDWFSFDQAGVDPQLATRSFGGIFATQRNVASAQTYSFDRFEVVESPTGDNDPNDPPPVGDIAVQFNRWTFPVPSQPTAAVVGSDGRLYVTTLFGQIFAFELDQASQTVVSTQTISSVQDAQGGNRLMLGIAEDPASTADNVILWVSHSSGSINNGGANSGVVSKLVGPNFDSVEDVLTGLPRAIANHAINGLDFGPDGRLYIAFGGNTGAGAANTAPSEFGDRPEQPLTAAVLAADVNAANFQGECATPVGQFGVPATCDAVVYASGLRNSYDLVWHLNGSLYATDNGLGVVGTHPPTPTPDCTAFGDVNLHNPGTQVDSLYRVEQGRYYGHPNPYRNECVFGDGSFQGVPPLPNYSPRLATLGTNKSANGIIDYRGDAFFGSLHGQLIIANFSQGDEITRTRLNIAGDTAIETTVIASNFNNPLGITQDDAGNILVTELGNSSIVILQPDTTGTPSGSFTDAAVLPIATLDPEGAAIGNELYVVAGETAAGATQALWIFDSVANAWRAGPDLPGVAVEDTATTALDGRFYVFGGSTDSFTGSVDNAAVFDPATNSWTELAPMPTPRGGAIAEVLNGLIYVAGGLDNDGQSLTTVEIYNPATNSWSTGPSLLVARDNAGAAVVDGKLYVMGGRTRFTNDTLVSMEILDPATNTWTAGADMTTGRRSLAVGTVGNRIQAVGGENPALTTNEEYNPATNTWRDLTPLTQSRHGAAAGTIGGRLYIVGGGETAGTSFTDSTVIFNY